MRDPVGIHLAKSAAEGIRSSALTPFLDCAGGWWVVVELGGGAGIERLEQRLAADVIARTWEGLQTWAECGPRRRGIVWIGDRKCRAFQVGFV